jgi:hypothetical protein
MVLVLISCRMLSLACFHKRTDLECLLIESHSTIGNVLRPPSECGKPFESSRSISWIHEVSLLHALVNLDE